MPRPWQSDFPPPGRTGQNASLREQQAKSAAREHFRASPTQSIESTMNFNRRPFIKAASSLTLASTVPSLAWAAGSCDKDLVVGTWGGDYQRLLQQTLDPLVKPEGIN